MNEPFFKFLLKKAIYGLFGMRIEESEDQEKHFGCTLNQLLLSSLNVELVCIILKGVVKFSKVSLDDIDPTKDQFKVRRKCFLNRIKIKEPEKWDVEKQHDQPLNDSDSNAIRNSNPYLNKPLNKDLTINEAVQITEYAPALFQTLR